MIDRFDGFAVTLHLDQGDGEYLTHFVELPEVSAFGETPEDALNELAIAWRLYKDSCAADGVAIPVAPSQKEYSGQFQVRVDRRLHKALVIEAALAGVSLNALVSQKLVITTQLVR